MAVETVHRNRLRALRLRARLTQPEVAKLLDVNVSTVNRHEAGARALTEDAITAYAQLYKVPGVAIFVEPGDRGLAGESFADGWDDDTIRRALRDLSAQWAGQEVAAGS